MPETCPFCDRIRLQQFDHTMQYMCSFEPLSPVTKGHRIVLPFAHIEAMSDFSPSVLGALSSYAVVVARINHIDQYNLITNFGEHATQSVPHLHMHIIPRTKGDGLALPWTAQKRTASRTKAEE